MNTWIYRIALALLLAFAFYWLYPNSEANPRPELWQIESQTQTPTVLGLTLEKTKLKDAMQILKGIPKLALFTQERHKDEPEQAKHLEAFFGDVFDEGDNIILGIQADEELLTHIKKEAYQPELFPSGVIRVGVRDTLYEVIQELPISSITILAGQQINFETFQSKFGKPEQLLDDGAGNAHFLYPKLGLDLIQPAGGEQILQFVSPSMFDEKLRNPLLKNSPHEVQIP